MFDTGDSIPGDVLESFTHLKTVQMVIPHLDEDGTPLPKSIVFHLFLERGKVN